jgi:hypothetical protein
LFESFIGNFSPKRLKNESFIESFISVFLLVVEARIDARLSTLGNGINIHMSQATFSLSAEINAHTTRTAEISTGIYNNLHSHLSEQL